MNEVVFFTSFLVGISILLLLDLGLFNKKQHVLSFREASLWVLLWVSLAIGFYFFILWKGELIHNIGDADHLKQVISQHKHSIDISGLNFQDALQVYRKNLGLEYLSGYIIEYALSIDNLFVMMLIFMSFKVPRKLYKKVLFWGILGAVIMRFLFIFTSSALIHRFDWILYIFGAFLVFTGGKMLFSKDKENNMDVSHHPIVKIASKRFKVFPRFVGAHFFIKKNGIRMITPLFLVLLVVEFSDVIFAVDSIPAIFSVTKDPEIVFFSNIFAILGLRSLFFLLSNVINMFHYLKTGLSVLLGLIGLKMLFEIWLKKIGFGTVESLIMIVSVLGLSIIASLIFPK
ncbi:MAG: TerC/Alx family metal homeostasis membrane protein, partial [Bacteroidales bacterium]|nr:TerC/Alx family metal homeostasis membrane protein [Bacteroidales bacterium]